MAAKPDHSAPATPPPAAPAPAPSGGAKAWLPVIAAVVLAPALSWAVAEFVLLPRLQRQLSAPPAGAAAGDAAPAAEARGKAGREGGASPANYEFQNVVVNLAGTMGTRYLKTSFIVTGADSSIGTVFTDQKAKLTDITLNVLSSLTLADLEEPGSKNILREKLVIAYNQALGKHVADQVYFSDFVVQ